MVTTINPPNRIRAWQYQEFLGSAQSKSTPRAGINAALTWLGDNNAPPPSVQSLATSTATAMCASSGTAPSGFCRSRTNNRPKARQAAPAFS